MEAEYIEADGIYVFNAPVVSQHKEGTAIGGQFANLLFKKIKPEYHES